MSVTSVSGKIKIDCSFDEIWSNGVNPGSRIPNQFDLTKKLPQGTASGEIDLGVFIAADGVAAGANTDYDLNALADALKGTQDFATVKLIAIRNNRTTALANLLIGPKDGTNGFGILGSPTAGKGFWNAGTERNVVAPGEGWVVLWNADGVPVNATFKDLRVTTSAVSGSTNSWDLMILGTSD